MPTRHNFDSDYYAFGGFSSAVGELDIIVKFDTRTYQWSRVGTLNTARDGASVIFVDSAFFVVGGAGKSPRLGVLLVVQCQCSN